MTVGTTSLKVLGESESHHSLECCTDKTNIFISGELQYDSGASDAQACAIYLMFERYRKIVFGTTVILDDYCS